MNELQEVGRTADAIRADLEAIFVRGLSTSTPNDRKSLVLRTEEWERVGAQHVASRIRDALRAADAEAADAPARLLSAYTTLHAFERVLSLEVAAKSWERHLALEQKTATAPGTRAEADTVGAKPLAALDDPKAAAKSTVELARIVEDLIRTGLTTASEATRHKLDAAFKEASRHKLLRLGASLRYVNEEIGRFLANDGTFAPRRYSFFLHRSWLLAKGTSGALARGDSRLVAVLSAGSASAPKPVGGPLDVVVLGIHKRVTSTVCTFDFRLRVTRAPTSALIGKSLVYSLVFVRKTDVPAEAYLHLPQPQKFTPKLFRDKTTVTVLDAAILPDERGGGRLVLGPKSTVTAGKPFAAWTDHYGWDPTGAAARVHAHQPSPLDLAVELQEEVVLDDWQLEKRNDELCIAAAGLDLWIAATGGAEGAALALRIEEAAKKKKRRPTLFGTVHYEFGRLAFAPLAFLDDDGPEYIMLSDEKINLAALLGSLNL